MFLSSERQIFVIVFNIDKSASLLTGRPPALAHRYCRFKLPLDLDEDGEADPEAWEAALQKLDVNGWSTEGRMDGSTVCRMGGIIIHRMKRDIGTDSKE